MNATVLQTNTIIFTYLIEGMREADRLPQFYKSDNGYRVIRTSSRTNAKQFATHESAEATREMLNRLYGTIQWTVRATVKKETAKVPASAKILQTSPTNVIRWCRELVEAGKLTKTQAQRMMKRWSITGALAIQDGDWAIFVTEEGMKCGCGKGLYCPQNIQVEMKLRRIVQRGGK